MRRRYDIPIIGMEPAAKKALDLDGTKRVLVAATPITVSGSKMQHLMERVDKEHLLDLLALPRLVEFAERGEFRSKRVSTYLQQELNAFDLQMYSAFVLGCTHFNYFKDTLREILPPNMTFVDGNEGTVRELARQLKNRDELSLNKNAPPLGESVKYFFSGQKVREEKTLAKIREFMARLNVMREI